MSCCVTVAPSFLRWALREQTDQVSAPQTAVSHGLASDHGEEASLRVHATTAATHHPEAEDGPSGEPRPRRLTSHTGDNTAPASTVGTEGERERTQVAQTTNDQSLRILHRKCNCVTSIIEVFRCIEQRRSAIFIFDRQGKLTRGIGFVKR